MVILTVDLLKIYGSSLEVIMNLTFYISISFY